MRYVTVLLISLAASPSSLAFLGSSPRFHPAPRTGPGAAQCGIRRVPGVRGLRLTGLGARGLRSVLLGTDARSQEQEEDTELGDATESKHGDAGQQVLWKDAAPQRTAGNDKKAWMNQFPNTWQPAETLALDRSLRNGKLAPKAHLGLAWSAQMENRLGTGSPGLIRTNSQAEGAFPHVWGASTSHALPSLAQPQTKSPFPISVNWKNHGRLGWGCEGVLYFRGAWRPEGRKQRELVAPNLSFSPTSGSLGTSLPEGISWIPHSWTTRNTLPFSIRRGKYFSLPIFKPMLAGAVHGSALIKTRTHQARKCWPKRCGLILAKTHQRLLHCLLLDFEPPPPPPLRTSAECVGRRARWSS